MDERGMTQSTTHLLPWLALRKHFKVCCHGVNNKLAAGGCDSRQLLRRVLPPVGPSWVAMLKGTVTASGTDDDIDATIG